MSQTGKKPFKDRTFYLDLKFYRNQEELLKNLKKLGGKVESFLSKDVTHVITDKSILKHKSDQWAPATPKSFGSILSPLTLCGDGTLGRLDTPASTNSPSNEVKASLLTRGHALLQKAKLKNEGTTDLLEVCSQWKIKVLPLQKVLNYILQVKKYMAKNKDHKEATKKKPVYNYFHQNLEPPFIKVEDLKRKQRPSYKVIKCWRDSFDQSLVRIVNKMQRKYSGVQVLKTNWSSNVVNSQTPSYSNSSVVPTASWQTHLCQRNSSTKLNSASTRSVDKSKYVERYAAGKENRARQISIKRNPAKKRYCEICNCTYSSLAEHLVSAKHKMFLDEPSNFRSIENMCSTLPDIEVFLKQPEECSINEDSAPKVLTNVPEGENAERADNVYIPNLEKNYVDTNINKCNTNLFNFCFSTEQYIPDEGRIISASCSTDGQSNPFPFLEDSIESWKQNGRRDLNHKQEIKLTPDANGQVNVSLPLPYKESKRNTTNYLSVGLKDFYRNAQYNCDIAEFGNAYAAPNLKQGSEINHVINGNNYMLQNTIMEDPAAKLNHENVMSEKVEPYSLTHANEQSVSHFPNGNLTYMSAYDHNDINRIYQEKIQPTYLESNNVGMLPCENTELCSTERNALSFNGIIENCNPHNNFDSVTYNQQKQPVVSQTVGCVELTMPKENDLKIGISENSVCAELEFSNERPFAHVNNMTKNSNMTKNLSCRGFEVATFGAEKEKTEIKQHTFDVEIPKEEDCKTSELSETFPFSTELVRNTIPLSYTRAVAINGDATRMETLEDTTHIDISYNAKDNCQNLELHEALLNFSAYTLMLNTNNVISNDSKSVKYDGKRHSDMKSNNIEELEKLKLESAECNPLFINETAETYGLLNGLEAPAIHEENKTEKMSILDTEVCNKTDKKFMFDNVRPRSVDSAEMFMKHASNINSKRCRGSEKLEIMSEPVNYITFDDNIGHRQGFESHKLDNSLIPSVQHLYPINQCNTENLIPTIENDVYCKDKEEAPPQLEIVDKEQYRNESSALVNKMCENEASNVKMPYLSPIKYDFAYNCSRENTPHNENVPAVILGNPISSVSNTSSCSNTLNINGCVIRKYPFTNFGYGWNGSPKRKHTENLQGFQEHSTASDQVHSTIDVAKDVKESVNTSRTDVEFSSESGSNSVHDSSLKDCVDVLCKSLEDKEMTMSDGSSGKTCVEPPNVCDAAVLNHNVKSYAAIAVQ